VTFSAENKHAAPLWHGSILHNHGLSFFHSQITTVCSMCLLLRGPVLDSEARQMNETTSGSNYR
jgi:hypothetical protein